MMMRALRLVPAAAVLMLAAASMAAATSARQDDTVPPASRTEASQIELPDSGTRASAREGRAYLDPAGRPAQPPPPRASMMQTDEQQNLRGESRTPASQISARGQGGSVMAQLSKADLDATLAQLSPAERRVLLQAIEGSDICDNPPDVAAIVALCQSRLETRAAEFTTLSEGSISAEDRLLSGDLDNSTLPSVDQVIERLARGGASSGDLSNQAIASIALGTSPAATAKPRDEETLDTSSISEEAQAMINALINQLGGRAP